MAVFVLLGAAVIAVGHQYGIRTVEPFRAEHVALMLGSAPGTGRLPDGAISQLIETDRTLSTL